MKTILKNTFEYILVDRENAQITLSKASLKLNEAQPAAKRTSFRTIADMERGKFGRMFDRHKVAYRY